MSGGYHTEKLRSHTTKCCGSVFWHWKKKNSEMWDCEILDISPSPSLQRKLLGKLLEELCWTLENCWKSIHFRAYRHLHFKHLEETGDGNPAKTPNKSNQCFLQCEDIADFVHIIILEIDLMQNKIGGYQWPQWQWHTGKTFLLWTTLLLT